MTDPLDLPSEWSPLVLGRVWDLVAKRLERNGIRASGRLVVTGLDLAERHSVGELIGREVMGDRVAIDLEVLDRLMSERDGMGLVAAVEEVRAEPLVARTARRAPRPSRRERPFEAAAEWLSAHPLAAWPWVDAWFGALRRDGTLLTDDDPTGVLRRALEVLWDRRETLSGAPVQPVRHAFGGPTPVVTLSRLAARTAHDAHALDSDRLLSAVVLRALAARDGATCSKGNTKLTGGADERRELWETAGVITDLVSSTCLTWGLLGHGLPGASRDRGRPEHLTGWDLEAGAGVTGPREILVCQHPEVLEAVARAGIDIGVICTNGHPNLVVTEVLTRARAGGARLRYHGDFNWPGIALANDTAARHGAVPWLMGTDDYLTAPGSIALGGAAIVPSWEPELGQAMHRRGVTVREEAVLDRLIEQLS